MPELINLRPENLHQTNWQQPGHNTMPVLSVQQVRALENAAFEHTDSFLLMQAAGIRTALKIMEQLARSKPRNPYCVVLAGPGNNGGDACIVAAELRKQGLDIELIQITKGTQGSKDRMQAVLWALANGVRPVELESADDLPNIGPNTLVIDGLLGIGCDRAPTGLLDILIKHVNTSVARTNRQALHRPVQVYSLDCPSGLNCNTGLAPGAAIQAHTTFSYLACKHGLLTGQGRTLSGQVWVEDLMCGNLLKELLNTKALGPVSQALSRQDQLQRLPVRNHEHHKGSFGSVAVLGGQHGMVGACVLATRTALMLGCGRVALSLLGETPFLDIAFPEIMNKSLQENLQFANTAIVGPGLGQTDSALNMLLAVLEHDIGLNMVWDADALNLLASNSTLRARLLHYRSKHPAKAMVFTPHPLEAARLLQSTTDMIQADRVAAAQSISKQFDCAVVLKGAGSLICKNAQLEINTTGGPALGTAGSGDVLAGAIGAMLGQGLNEFDAAAFSVHLHGLSIEALHGEQDGLLISHASEISERMKLCLNHQLNQSARRHGQLP